MSYLVTIKVKPYVKKYLENEFGSPIRFPDKPNGSHYYSMLAKMLTKPSVKYNNDRSGRQYAENKFMVETKIEISAYLFYSYGWEISTTDQMAFNSFVEGILKELLLICVKVNSNYCNKMISGIRNFREITGLTEDDYAHDTIKQYIYRLGLRKKSFSAMSPKIQYK